MPLTGVLSQPVRDALSSLAPYAVPAIGLVAAGAYVFARRLQSPRARASVVLAACAVPLASLETLPPLKPSTMMSTALAGMLTIHLTSAAADVTFPVQGPAAYARGILWYALPLEETRLGEEERTWRAVAAMAASALGHAALKLVAGAWLRQLLLRLLTGEAQAAIRGSYWLCAAVSTVFFLMVVAGDPTNDLLRAAVPAVTGGRYTVLAFNDWPLLSTSVGDFWGRRYNRLVSSLLRDRVFRPLRAQAGWPAQDAALAAFAASGLLHALVAINTFRERPAHALAFFLAHGLAASAEHRLGLRERLGALGGWLWTASFLFALSPLYMGLFPRAGAAFLTAEPLPPAVEAAHSWVLAHLPLPPLPSSSSLASKP